MKLFLLPKKYIEKGVASHLFYFVKMMSLFLCLLCIGAFIYYGASMGSYSLESVEKYGSFFSAILAGIAAFATLGTLIHLLEEREETKLEREKHNQILQFDLYDKHQQQFESKLERISNRLNCDNCLGIKQFRFSDPRRLYEEIFCSNSVHSMTTVVCDKTNSYSLIFTLKSMLENILLNAVEFVEKNCEIEELTSFTDFDHRHYVSFHILDAYSRLGIEPLTEIPLSGDTMDLGSRKQTLTNVNVFCLQEAVECLFEITNEIGSFCGLAECDVPETVCEMSNPLLLYAVLISYRESELFEGGFKAYNIEFGDDSFLGIERLANVYQYWKKTIDNSEDFLTPVHQELLKESLLMLYIPLEDSIEKRISAVNSIERLRLFQHTMQKNVEVFSKKEKEVLLEAFTFLGERIREAA